MLSKCADIGSARSNSHNGQYDERPDDDSRWFNRANNGQRWSPAELHVPWWSRYFSAQWRRRHLGKRLAFFRSTLRQQRNVIFLSRILTLWKSYFDFLQHWNFSSSARSRRPRPTTSRQSLKIRRLLSWLQTSVFFFCCSDVRVSSRVVASIELWIQL